MSVQITYTGRYNENLMGTFLSSLKFLFCLPEYVLCFDVPEDGPRTGRNMYRTCEGNSVD